MILYYYGKCVNEKFFKKWIVDLKKSIERKQPLNSALILADNELRGPTFYILLIFNIYVLIVAHEY